MEQLVPLIIEKGAAQGFPTLLMMGMIAWFHYSNRGLVKSLVAERAKGDAAYGERIKALEASAKECQSDRSKLHEAMNSLLMRLLSKVTAEEACDKCG